MATLMQMRAPAVLHNNNNNNNRTSRPTQAGIGHSAPAHRGGHVQNRSRRRKQRFTFTFTPGGMETVVHAIVAVLAVTLK